MILPKIYQFSDNLRIFVEKFKNFPESLRLLFKTYDSCRKYPKKPKITDLFRIFPEVCQKLTKIYDNSR